MNDDPSPTATAATGRADAQWARALAGKRLLVTGAAGFTAAHCSAAFASTAVT